MWSLRHFVCEMNYSGLLTQSDRHNDAIAVLRKLDAECRSHQDLSRPLQLEALRSQLIVALHLSGETSTAQSLVSTPTDQARLLFHRASSMIHETMSKEEWDQVESILQNAVSLFPPENIEPKVNCLVLRCMGLRFRKRLPEALEALTTTMFLLAGSDDKKWSECASDLRDLLRCMSDRDFSTCCEKGGIFEKWRLENITWLSSIVADTLPPEKNWVLLHLMILVNDIDGATTLLKRNVIPLPATEEAATRLKSSLLPSIRNNRSLRDSSFLPSSLQTSRDGGKREKKTKTNKKKKKATTKEGEKK